MKIKYILPIITISLIVLFTVSVSASITLSHSDFFYRDSISVEIKFELEGASNVRIYYTTNGTEPTKSSAQYRSAIRFDPTNGLELRAVPLKVKAYYNMGGTEHSTNILTHTYIITENVNQRFSNMIVFSITTEPANLNDPVFGIAVPGVIRERFIRENPGHELIPPDPANFNMRGREWERPVFVEAFESNGRRVIAQNAGLRVHGGWSRAAEQKSLRLYARRSYDESIENGRFNYAFFPGAASISDYPTPIALDSFKRILLRNNANDNGFGFLREEFSARLAGMAGYPTAKHNNRPAVIFMNGAYYGFAWLQERPDEYFLEQRFNAPERNFTIMNVGESSANDIWHWIDEEGSSSWSDFNYVSRLLRNDMSKTENYEYFRTFVDVEDLAMYYAVQIIAANRDWPHNNMRMWRYNGDPVENNPYLDGRWRFIMYDVEMAWGLYDSNTDHRNLGQLLGEPNHEGSSSAFLISLMKNRDFKNLFVNTICDLLSDSFSVDNMLAVLNELSSISDREVEFMRSFTPNRWPTIQNIRSERTNLRTYVRARPNIVHRQLTAQFPELSQTFTIVVEGAEGMRTRLNTMPINGRETKKGVYYRANTVPLTTTEMSDGFEFCHWIVNGERVDSRELLIDRDMIIADFVTVQLVAVKHDVAPVIISSISHNERNGWMELRNTSNRPVSLNGFHLTDRTDRPGRFAFPNVTIPANGTLSIAYANNRNPEQFDGVLPFNPSRNETLLLTDSNGFTLSRFVVPRLYANEEYTFNAATGLYHIIEQRN
jgi:hypothetical protein